MIVRNSHLNGSIDAPPSKSYTHRAIICAMLADGISTIQNPLISDDTEATLVACEILGAEILEKSHEKIVIKGNSGKISARSKNINCRESGSTLRFIIPLAAFSDKEIVFTGKSSLAKRPVEELLKVLEELGVRSEFLNENNTLPTKIHGAKTLKGGKIKIRGDISSQFISGLLFALPLCEGNSEIILTTNPQSKDYLAITLDILENFGINIDCSEDFKHFKIKGNQKYKAEKYRIEGDYSSAAFMLAAGALTGAVTVNNLNKNSKQGDRKIIDVLKLMNGKLTIKENSVSIEKSKLKSTKIDARDIPDIIPILALLATQANGTTTISNVERLRIKESDRLTGISNILKSSGAKIQINKNSLIINGGSKLHGTELETLNDHRLVMAASVAGLIAEGEVVIRDPIAIKKSYPTFFDDLRKLNADMMAMSSTFGNSLKLTLIGESHAKRIGAIITGVPKGIQITQEFIQSELEKRRSVSSLTTPRREADLVNIVSGIKNGKTTGETIRLEIENKDVNSETYEKMKNLLRPGHADYTAREKYASVFDYRGGGFLSGRMTACYVAAGAIAKKILEKNEIKVLAYTKQIGNVKVEKEPTDEEIEENRFSNFVRCPDLKKAKDMEQVIEKVKSEGDSLGGIIECRILNMSVGIGEPIFNSIESQIAQAMFSIPAVKGVEFGSGFSAASMKGSKHNDPIRIENGRVVTVTNNAGGIQGGLSNAMPLIFRIAIKPTSSIAKEQDTIDVNRMQAAKIKVLGRHDPCIAIRVSSIVEAMAAISIADLLITGNFLENPKH